MSRLALLLAFVAALALAACGGEEAAAPETTASEGGCREVPLPAPKPEPALSPPTSALDTTAVHRVVAETSCGTFTITLDPVASPNAAASFRALAERGFFDGTIVHRVIPGFVIQGGDPTGSGAGGPGYTTVDPPPPNTTYTRGTVAMAKSAAEPPGTAGSQFFVVTADAQLQPDYAVIGRVTEGMDTVDRIEALGTAGAERPSRPVLVDRMTLAGG